MRARRRLCSSARRAPRCPTERRSRAPSSDRPSGPRLCRIHSCLLTDDAHFSFQPDAGLLRHDVAHVLDQLLYVDRSRTPTGIDDEIRMLLRHARAADAEALEPATLDEPRGVVARWIAEHAPRIRQIERLGGDPLREKLADAHARGLAIAQRKPEPRRREDPV